MLLLPLLCGIQSSTLDLTIRASSLDKVVAQIGQKSGERLSVSPKLRERIVFVRATGGVAEIKTALADAVDGTWMQTKEGDVLTRQAEQEKQIWARHVAVRRKYLNSELVRLQEQLAKPFNARALATGLKSLPSNDTPGQSIAVMRARGEMEADLFSKGPVSRLMYRLILACNPDVLAGVGPYSRTIVRLNPTRMQVGFDPKKYKAALAEFEKELSAWTEEAAKVKFPLDRNGRMVTDPRSHVNLSAADLQNLELELKRGQAANLLSANLIDLNSEMAMPILCQTTLNDASRNFLMSVIDSKEDQTDAIVPLSHDSEAFDKRVRSSLYSSGSESLTGRVAELLLDPVQHEPLGFSTSDGLLAYANLEKANVVAAVPDSAMSMTWFVSREKPLRVRQFMRALLDSGTMTRTENGGFKILKPTDVFESELDFSPRAPVAALMKAVTAKGRVDARDYAKYAFDSGRLSRSGVGDWYLALYDRSILSGLDYTDWDACRLYGSFNANQQTALENGAAFPFTGMSAAQRAILQHITYSGRIESPNFDPTEQATLISNAPVEPTVAFVNGLPTDGTVRASSSDSPVIVSYCKTESGKVVPTRSLNVWTLASVEVDAKGNEQAMQSYGVKGLVGYAMGKTKTLRMRVQLGPKLWHELKMSLPVFDQNARPVSWEQLPEPYVKQIKDAIEQRKSMRTNQGGSVIPPR